MFLHVHLCPTLCDPMDHGPPGSSVHGILQARILEWVATPSSWGSPWPSDQPASLVSLALQADSLSLSHRGRIVIYLLRSFFSGFPGGRDSKESACSAGDPGLISASGRSLEQGMAIHSSVLACRNPWIEEPGGLQSLGSQRVGHDWATDTFTFFSTRQNQRETELRGEGGKWHRMKMGELFECKGHELFSSVAQSWYSALYTEGTQHVFGRWKDGWMDDGWGLSFKRESLAWGQDG